MRSNRSFLAVPAFFALALVAFATRSAATSLETPQPVGATMTQQELASCPVTGATGASTLSFEEVMRRMHDTDGSCPHMQAKKVSECPHHRGKSAVPPRSSSRSEPLWL